MYAFSAAVNYLLVFVALLRLRFTDTETPRTFKVPWNVPIRRPSGVYEIPIVGVIGLLFLIAVLVMVVLTNEIGRVAGPLWVIAGGIFFALYRRHRGLPVLQSLPRDWTHEQLEVYAESGETGLVEEYQTALKRKAREQNKPGPNVPRT
jgi:APA family basic amino acid/polyamine antiporter